MKKIHKPGLYIIFNAKKEIIYIGKSHSCMVKRGLTSFKDKNMIYSYDKYEGTEEITLKSFKAQYISFLSSNISKSDINVYEIYLINKYKPVLNRDCNASDNLTILLPECFFSKLIKIDNYVECIWIKEAQKYQPMRSYITYNGKEINYADIYNLIA